MGRIKNEIPMVAAALIATTIFILILMLPGIVSGRLAKPTAISAIQERLPPLANPPPEDMVEEMIEAQSPPPPRAPFTREQFNAIDRLLRLPDCSVDVLPDNAPLVGCAHRWNT